MLNFERLLWLMQGQMLNNMLRLLNRGSVSSAEWQLKRLQELGVLNDMNTQALKRNREQVLEVVKKEIKNNVMQKIKDTNRQVGRKAFEIPANIVDKTLQRFEATVYLKLEVLHQGMLKGMGQKYVEIVNVATAKTALGMSGRKAMNEIVDNWITQGLPMIQGKAGRNWTPEAYAQTLVRTTSTQVNIDSQFDFCNEEGYDLIEISSHLGARPLCALDQGRIFSRSGNSAKYPAFTESTYGEPAGLFGINCRHTFAPYVEGMGRTWQPYGAAENAKVYEESQEQRKIERDIRKAKLMKNKELVKEKQAVMREFIKDTGRTREYEREQIRRP